MRMCTLYMYLLVNCACGLACEIELNEAVETTANGYHLPI